METAEKISLIPTKEGKNRSNRKRDEKCTQESFCRIEKSEKNSMQVGDANSNAANCVNLMK